MRFQKKAHKASWGLQIDQVSDTANNTTRDWAEVLNNREHYLDKLFDWGTWKVSDQFLMFAGSLENTVRIQVIWKLLQVLLWFFKAGQFYPWSFCPFFMWIFATAVFIKISGFVLGTITFSGKTRPLQWGRGCCRVLQREWSTGLLETQ